MNTLEYFDRKKIIELLQQQRVQSYSFSILFFVIFTFFVVFAIRPNIITAFNLQRELQDLRLKDKEYEQKIIKIVNYQSLLEGYRDELPLLDDALPTTPLLGDVIKSVEKSASSSGLILSNIDVQKVEYKGKKQQSGIKSFHITSTTQTDFAGMQHFVQRILDQRRLKEIEAITITGDQFTSSESSGINNYRLDIVVSAHYL